MKDERISLGDLEIAPARYLAWRAGREICLTAQGFHLLVALAREPGKIFTRAELVEVIGHAHGENSPIRSVDDHIFRIRRRLGPPNIIRTVKDVGYGLRVD